MDTMQTSAKSVIAGLLVGAIVAGGTGYLSYAKLKQPDGWLDWLALIFSGLTTGIIAFFLVWGHFQKDPVPPEA